jgi:putative transposase
MARPYSVDLRERVVRAVEQEGLSRREAAKRFGVGIKTAIIWVQRFRTTGSVAPSRMGGNRPKKIIGGHREWLVKRCQGGDFTLRGLVAELARRGLEVDYRVVWAFVHAEKLTHKKRRWSPASATART